MSSQLVWCWKSWRRRFQNVPDLAQLQSVLQTPGYRSQGRYNRGINCSLPNM